jgi:hypothetical protein
VSWLAKASIFFSTACRTRCSRDRP